MKKDRIIKNFNIILNQFLVDTQPVLGCKYLLLFKTIKLYNNKKPLEDFKFYLQYKEQLFNKNIDFFFTDKFQSNINEFIFKKYALTKLDDLKQIYNDLEEDNRKKLWDIIFALITLSEKYEKIIQLELI
jgi:hypothetical protein